MNALAEKGLVGPFCLARAEQGRGAVPITNCMLNTVFLPQRFLAAVLEAEATANICVR